MAWKLNFVPILMIVEIEKRDQQSGRGESYRAKFKMDTPTSRQVIEDNSKPFVYFYV